LLDQMSAKDREL